MSRLHNIETDYKDTKKDDLTIFTAESLTNYRACCDEITNVGGQTKKWNSTENLVLLLLESEV